jgi:broad specificity phosphatase PhoE
LLTETGHEQCRKLNEHLSKEESLAKEIEVVVCSPMKRTIQTMTEGLEGVLKREEVRVEMSALWQGGWINSRA